MTNGKLSRKAVENLQTNILPPTDCAMVNKTFDKIMAASGIIALVWILAFLLVAMIEKLLRYRGNYPLQSHYA